MTKRSTGESSRGSHLVSCLAHCPRRYGFRYLIGLVPPSNKEGIARGNCNHAGIDAYYHGEDYRHAILTADEKDAYMAHSAIPIVEAYTRKYPIEVRNGNFYEPMGRVVFVETEFEMTIGGEETMTRRLDLGIASDRGFLFILDHKTSARISDKLKKTSLDPTLFTQDMIGRKVVAPKYGLRWGGLILNMLPTKPDESKFLRQHVEYTQEFINEAEKSICYWLKQERMVRAAFDDGRLDPWTLAQSFNCYPSGYSCDYWWLCVKGKAALSRYEVKK